jgi:hypothetical protein
MKHFMAVLLVLILIPMATEAVEDGQVMYAGGTVAGLKEGSIGKLDTKSLDSLTFESAGRTIVIPYARIDSYEYSHPVARHLGVLPAIAVGMVKKRQRRHFFRISYRDEAGNLRVALFEVPKQMPPVLLAVLGAKAQGRCSPTINVYCTAMR